VLTFGRINNRRGVFSGARRPVIGLRMAPMIDLIFLLLLFFLVAVRWRPKEEFLPLQLPVAAAGISAQTIVKPEPLLFQISPADAGCQVQIGVSHIVDIPAQNPEQGLALLMEKTKQCLLEQKRYAADPVEILCAGDVKWEYLAKIYNVLYGMGLSDITFRMTESPKNDSHD
jgi:biopolymer transport protein ExbD